jgi:hypothetical protein
VEGGYVPRCLPVIALPLVAPLVIALLVVVVVVVVVPLLYLWSPPRWWWWCCWRVCVGVGTSKETFFFKWGEAYLVCHCPPCHSAAAPVALVVVAPPVIVVAAAVVVAVAVEVVVVVVVVAGSWLRLVVVAIDRMWEDVGAVWACFG